MGGGEGEWDATEHHPGHVEPSTCQTAEGPRIPLTPAGDRSRSQKIGPEMGWSGKGR